MIKHVRKIIFVFFGLLLIYISAMTFVSCLDLSRMKNNAQQGISLLEKEGPWPHHFFGSNESDQLDNFTDKVMLEKSAISFHEYNNPLASAMDMGGYGRYWHGYEVILRPLLTMFSYVEIRFINTFFILGAFLLAAVKIKNNAGRRALFSFFVSMCFIKIFITPMSMQFVNMIFLMLISVVISEKVFLKKDFLTNKNSEFFSYFFILGSITSFLDLLTTPVLPLGMTLLYLIVGFYKKHKHVLKKNTILWSGIAWGVGYAMTWISKWVIASLVTPNNLIKEGFNQVIYRSSGNMSADEGGIKLDRVHAISKNLKMLISPFERHSQLLLVVVSVIIFLVLIIFYKRKNINWSYILNIFMVSLLPFVWYIIVGNHSQVHYWFTYRSLAITIFGIFYIALYVIDFERILSSIKKNFAKN